MRTVKLIRDLVIDEVPYYAPGDVQYYRQSPMDMCPAGDGGAICDASVSRESAQITPISRIIDGARRDTYIAYSSMVEEALELPINLIARELRELKELSQIQRQQIHKLTGELDDLKELTDSSWKRFKYFWRGLWNLTDRS